MFKKFIFQRQNVMCAAAFLLALTISLASIHARAYRKLGTAKGTITALSGQVLHNFWYEDTNITEYNFEDLLPSISELEDTSKDEKIRIHTYTIKSGDTLSNIASAYNIKVSTITESNKIAATSILKEGQVLEFPSVDGILYRIKNGETLWDIAVANKVDINRIIEVNNLETPDKLHLGQQLIIPDVDKLANQVSSTTTTAKSSATLSSGGSAVSFSMPVSGKITSTF